MLAGSHFGDYAAGYRLARVGYELVERRGLRRFQAPTYHPLGDRVMPWTKPIRACRDILYRGFDAANRVGPYTYVAFSGDRITANFLAAGDPLADTQHQAENGLMFARRAGFGLVADLNALQLALVRTLRGLTPQFGCLDHEQFDELGFERHVSGNQAFAVAECRYSIRKLQARFFAGDYAAAVDAASRAKRVLWTSLGSIDEAEYEFYAGLARAASWNTAAGDDRQLHFDALVAHHGRVDEWARNCAENFATRAALLRAEIARIEGRALDAERFYEQAIDSARRNGFVHNEALADELAARFYAARGLARIARAYLGDARQCYLRWGADGKVRQLEQLHPDLRAEDLSSRPSSTIVASVERLDLATVLKVSQAVSGEIVLPKLIERLMRIAVEHAGAERGLLILLRGDAQGGEPRIEAEATTRLGEIEVVARHAAITPADLPQSVLHYAIRTQERVLLDDASTDNVYAKDEYVWRKRSRSVLCLPIVKQTKLIGALYLENNLTPFAFTPERVSALDLLASQAAISLENAGLYADLELQVGLLQRLPVSAWTLDPDGTPDFVNQVWLEFSGQTLDFVRSHPEAWMTAVHPEDREMAARSFWEGVRSGQGFALETRSLRAQDGSYRWHLQQAVVLRDAEGKVVKFVGTTTDIDDQKRAEEASRQAQGDLARINRVTTMGELTASLAHEISQPISGAITNASVCLRKLGRDKPDLDEVRAAVTRIARDAQRAAEIIDRIRSQFERAPRIERLSV